MNRNGVEINTYIPEQQDHFDENRQPSQEQRNLKEIPNFVEIKVVQKVKIFIRMITKRWVGLTNDFEPYDRYRAWHENSTNEYGKTEEKKTVKTWGIMFR
jgi:hypothetical protein